MATETITTSCVIAGGGPAGMMCGFLLARAGVDVVVLEKHADFLRDFRGDTVHPSTLQIMYELGLLDAFLRRPHQEVRELASQIGDDRVMIADFSHLPIHCRFIAMMPQWDFLDFVAEHAKLYPSFKLKMLAKADGLMRGRRRDRWTDGQAAARPARGEIGSRHWRRRAPLHRAGEGWSKGRGSRRADGRALVPPRQAG